MKIGIDLIAEERKRQIEVEGYSAQHDSQHKASDLIYAAIAYAESAKVGTNCNEIGNTNEHEIMRRKTEMGRYYPFGWTFKPSTDIRDLVKAGALIAAAIDRLQTKDYDKQGWTEEDDEMSNLLRYCINEESVSEGLVSLAIPYSIDDLTLTIHKIEDWLKSLKQRLS